MLSLLRQSDPNAALRLLQDCRRELGGVSAQFSILDRLYAYQKWSSDWARLLSSAVTPAEVERLITSPRYWALQSVDPSVHGAVDSIVSAEVTDRTQALEAATGALRDTIRLFDGGQYVVVVPDTSTVLQHQHEFPRLQWNAITEVRGNVPLLVVVLPAVIRELDTHKRSRAQAPQGGVAVRTQARNALRSIGDLITEPFARVRIVAASGGAEIGLKSEVHLTVLTDDLQHTRLPTEDVEIIDRCVSMQPYVREVHLVTYDRAMALTARQFGVIAHELEFPDP